MVRSVIGKTRDDEWADILQEKIILQGLTSIKVKGISHRKFLITFQSKEDMDGSQMDILKQWFWHIGEATHLDLIPPRIAWIYCDGLPFTAWNLENWQSIIGDWGIHNLEEFYNN